MNGLFKDKLLHKKALPQCKDQTIYHQGGGRVYQEKEAYRSWASEKESRSHKVIALEDKRGDTIQTRKHTTVGPQ